MRALKAEETVLLKYFSIGTISRITQVVVFVCGIAFATMASLSFAYYVNGLSISDHKRTSQEAGLMLVQGISKLENSMRLMGSVVSLSETRSREDVVEKIRRNTPYLRHFDQVIWLYEETPGSWQYKTITAKTFDEKSSKLYRIEPDKRLITRLVNEGVFKQETINVITNFDGMDYIEESQEPLTRMRSFAFLKTIEAGRSDLGVIIGISHANLVFDQSFVLGSETISRFTIRDKKSAHTIYHMDAGGRGTKPESLRKGQHYNFTVGDAEWEIVLEFKKKKNILVLEKIPFFIFILGSLLTCVIALFLRNNQKQSQRLEHVNKVLKEKHTQLKSEMVERERLNDTIKVSEKDNRAIIDAVSDIIFETDTEGTVLFLSSAWQSITGFETDRSCGSNLFSMLDPQDLEKLKNDFDLLVRGKKTSYRTFTRIRTSDGLFRSVELAVSMIRQDENKNLRVVGTITDVEERRRAERALGEAEKKYRMIVENAAGGLYQLTSEGIYLSANPSMARILGYNSPADLLRQVKNANGGVYPDPQERETFTETILHQGQIFGYECQVFRKDNSRIWVRENVRAVTDDQNNLLYFEGSMEDITKKKEADIALMEAKIQSDIANRTKTEFIANMSHELRTPLNAIIGFSDILKNEVMGPLGQDIYKEYVGDIHKSGKGLLKIINEILEISKIEAGNRDLNESEFSLNSVLDSILDLYESRAKQKDIVLLNDIKEMPDIIGEEISIKQVIGNVYSNAIQYTPEKGRITLFSTFDSDGTFRLSISDTGVGMTTAEIDKALSAFGQVDNALDRSGAGTGLGLPLVQAIMGIHDGRMDIISEKSIGTTVTIIFPPQRVIRKRVKVKETEDKTPL